MISQQFFSIFLQMHSIFTDFAVSVHKWDLLLIKTEEYISLNFLWHSRILRISGTEQKELGRSIKKYIAACEAVRWYRGR